MLRRVAISLHSVRIEPSFASTTLSLDFVFKYINTPGGGIIIMDVHGLLLERIDLFCPADHRTCDDV
jgi:hypothetical protein